MGFDVWFWFLGSFWWKNRWVSIPGLPGDLVIREGNPSIALEGHLCAR